MKTHKDYKSDAQYYASIAGRQGALVAIAIKVCGEVAAPFSEEMSAKLASGASKSWKYAEMAISNGFEL